MQFVSMPESETINAVYILRGVQEEYIAKWIKLCMHFVDLEKAFDRVLRNVLQWALRKKGLL